MKKQSPKRRVYRALEEWLASGYFPAEPSADSLMPGLWFQGDLDELSEAEIRKHAERWLEGYVAPTKDLG